MPTSNRADQAIVAGSFKAFCEARDIKMSLAPPIWQNRATIESKHYQTRLIFLKLADAYPEWQSILLAQRAVSISVDLYGNSTMFAFKLAKGYIKPIHGPSGPKVLDEILDVQARQLRGAN